MLNLGTVKNKPLTGMQDRVRNKANFNGKDGYFDVNDNLKLKKHPVDSSKCILSSGVGIVGNTLFENVDETEVSFGVDGSYKVFVEINLSNTPATISLGSVDKSVTLRKDNLEENTSGIYQGLVGTVEILNNKVDSVVNKLVPIDGTSDYIEELIYNTTVYKTTNDFVKPGKYYVKPNLMLGPFTLESSRHKPAMHIEVIKSAPEFIVSTQIYKYIITQNIKAEYKFDAHLAHKLPGTSGPVDFKYSDSNFTRTIEIHEDINGNITDKIYGLWSCDNLNVIIPTGMVAKIMLSTAGRDEKKSPFYMDAMIGKTIPSKSVGYGSINLLGHGFLKSYNRSVMSGIYYDPTKDTKSLLAYNYSNQEKVPISVNRSKATLITGRFEEGYDRDFDDIADSSTQNSVVMFIGTAMDSGYDSIAHDFKTPMVNMNVNAGVALIGDSTGGFFKILQDQETKLGTTLNLSNISGLSDIRIG